MFGGWVRLLFSGLRHAQRGNDHFADILEFAAQAVAFLAVGSVVTEDETKFHVTALNIGCVIGLVMVPDIIYLPT